ncbi:MAG: hypothetical protein ACOZE5_02400 [Verrucomicrobiota bacterium]
MKTLLLPACFAAVAAAAAELKGPAEVARDWNQTVQKASELWLTTDSLSGLNFSPGKHSPPPVTFRPDTPAPMPRPTQELGPLYDASGYRGHRHLPHDRPPGARHWHYRGQTYWLVPLSTPNDE